jgi:AraC-like DNA-binding protein
MSILFEERASDSPYVATIMHGRTVGEGSTIRPAECHWHMVIVRHNGRAQVLAVGPWQTAGLASWGGEAEILWIRFKLGVYMPHLPTRKLRDRELALPAAADHAFWLQGAAWQLPNHENVDTFVNRLAREGALARDPVVTAVLDGQQPALSPRTIRGRFLRSVGLTQSHIYQVERANRAAALLAQGASILDTVHELGYFDQPHLTRSLKQWIGRTPGQLARLYSAACHFVQDSEPQAGYDTNVLLKTL